MKLSKFLLFISFALVVAALVCQDAHADFITFGLDTEFSGGTSPENFAPWITATFDDSFGGQNDVRLTMSAVNLVDAESIKNWFFNFDPVLDPTLLSFSVVGTPGSVPNYIYTGIDAYKAAGDGYYDIKFAFPPPQGDFSSRFTKGETVVYDISYTSPISFSSFNFTSAPENNADDMFATAAHIQRIGPDNEYSGWITNGSGGTITPEPVSSILFITGGATLALRRYLRKK